ncbi:hypothetical protein [Paenibacillus sp. sgz500958]|uniref:hypothetical protein n=1 Tax=Paenibacillus sp. sgz500958 TaxID=3242475 RepID=UPI0036D3EE4A
MMKNPYTQEANKPEVERKDKYQPTESSIAAANAIKYTAYILLFFGFLYFLVAFLAPML